MQPQQPNGGPPQGPWPPQPPQPGGLPSPNPYAPPASPGGGAPNVYTTQLPQGSRYASPLDTQPGTPMAPQGAQYDFITANRQPNKKGLFGMGGGSSGGMSLTKQIALGVGLLAFVGLIIAIGASIYLSGRSDGAQEMLKLAANQTEIIRISDIGMKKARATEAQVLASTTKYSIQSDLNKSVASLKKHRLKANSVTLGTAKNTKVDTVLALASQNNRFDEEFLSIMSTMLVTYQKQVKTTYDASTNTFDKQILADSYKHINTILGEATPAPGASPEPAATPAPTPGPVGQ